MLVPALCLRPEQTLGADRGADRGRCHRETDLGIRTRPRSTYPSLNRQASASPTAAVQTPATARSQSVPLSEPMPRACTRAIGHSAYVAQCTDRKTPGTDTFAEQADDRDHQEQIDGERAEPQPDRSVGAEEGSHEVDDPELRERVEEKGGDVQRDERCPGQGGGAMEPPATPNRPTPRGARPERVTMPSTSETVNIARATTPVPRPKAHSAESE